MRYKLKLIVLCLFEVFVFSLLYLTLLMMVS